MQSWPTLLYLAFLKVSPDPILRIVVSEPLAEGVECPRTFLRSALSSEADIVRGMFQCVKYRAVLEGQQAGDGRSQGARAILALEAKFPSKFLPLKNILGAELVDEIKVP